MTKEFWQLFFSWLTKINLTKLSITLEKNTAWSL